MKSATIFGFAGSTYTRTARMVCIEKQVPHQLVPLEFGAASHRARHPFLKMPALEHEGVRLYETLAIASYIDAFGPGPGLRPAPGVDQAIMYQWISVAIDYFYRDLVAAMLDSKPVEDTSRIGQAFDLIDASLGDRPFLAGASVSLADLFLAPMVGFARDKAGIDLDGRRSMQRWWTALSERPSFRETAS